MSRRLLQIAAVLVVIFAAAQLVRTAPTSAPIDPARTIQAALGPTSALPAVLDRGCNDCHSNNAVSSWYTQVAPFSWLMAQSVAEGRKAVNFSEWAGYPPDVRRTLLVASCDDATSGKMPGPYTLFRADAKLSPQDVQTICAAAREP